MVRTLLETLMRLEVELTRPLGDQDRHGPGDLLHRDFREVGLSGRVYSRSEVMAALAVVPPARRIVLADMAAYPVTADVVLLTYRSHDLGPDGSTGRPAHRSSLWTLEGGHWRILHHQATPAADL